MKLNFINKLSMIGFFCSSIIFGAGTELYNQGLKAEADQNWAKASELFQQSLEKEGETVDCLNHLGFTLAKSSEELVNQAYMHLIKAAKQDPKNEVTLEHLGSIYINQGKITKANENLQELKKIKSTEAEVLAEKLKPVVMQAKQIKGVE